MASSAIPLIGVSEIPWINVMDYGAVANDLIDNTAAFNNALAAAVVGQTVFVPPGIYRVNGDITVPAFQSLEGGGRHGTVINVTTNSQTNGLINLSMGTTLRNISISYDQPEPPLVPLVTGIPDYSVFIHYKPAIRITSSPWGATVENVRITRAWDGIDVGSSGRTYFRNIEMSMFNRGFIIDDTQDTVRIENLHVWPFGMTGNQLWAFYLPFTNPSGHSVALYLGRADGLHVHNMMAINGTAIDAHAGTGGGPNVFISDSDFDAFASIQWSASVGTGLFSNCQFSSATQFPNTNPAAQNSFVLTGGRIMVANSHFFGLATGGMIQVGGGNMQVSNCRFTSVVGDQPSIAESAGTLQVNGCFFDRPINTTYATPIIKLTGGNAIITSNIAKDKGTLTGDFIKNTSGGVTTIVNNIYTGWTIS